MLKTLLCTVTLTMTIGAALAQTAPGGALPDAVSGAERQAGGRSDENAVRQAEDAFGTSVGRETIGLYNAASVRGFSPIAAGNARIEGLYFDQVWTLSPRIRRSTTIRVGMSAQGYPFPAPTGIVDYSFRKPGSTAKLSVQLGGDSFGASYIDVDTELPLNARTLSMGIGGSVLNSEYANGTDARYRNAALTLRWTPNPEFEIVPFWHRSEGFDDEEGPVYVPRGATLPPRVARRRFQGPDWADYRGSAINYGALATLRAGAGWTWRAGVFRSMYDDQRSFTHLLTNVTSDGAAQRILIADPPTLTASTSGELRATRAVAEGPRLHTVHLSVRARERKRHYDGSQVIDLGPATIGAPYLGAEPAYRFSEQTRDRTRQWSGGLAYDGRWRDIGEVGFSVQKSDYRKHLDKPTLLPVTASDKPWLYNVSAAVYLSARLAAFGGFTRGLEESGVAPENAANRNGLLPAIRTTQADLGLRYALASDIKLVAAVFDVRKPYFNFDGGARYSQLGEVRNQGLELSLAGRLTPRLNVVAGAVLSRPRATGEGVRLGRVGARPVGLAKRNIELNLDWRTPWLDALSLDMTASHSGAVTATVDNRVAIPARTLVALSGRYRFSLLERPATLRVAVNNLFDVYGYELKGAGAYDVIAGRLASAYLSVDF